MLNRRRNDVELQRSPFGLRMPEEVQNWIKMKAKRENRSQNYVINRILAKAMEDEHAKV